MRQGEAWYVLVRYGYSLQILQLWFGRVGFGEVGCGEVRSGKVRCGKVR